MTKCCSRHNRQPNENAIVQGELCSINVCRSAQQPVGNEILTRTEVSVYDCLPIRSLFFFFGNSKLEEKQKGSEIPF